MSILVFTRLNNPQEFSTRSPFQIDLFSSFFAEWIVRNSDSENETTVQFKFNESSLQIFQVRWDKPIRACLVQVDV